MLSHSHVCDNDIDNHDLCFKQATCPSSTALIAMYVSVIRSNIASHNRHDQTTDCGCEVMVIVLFFNDDDGLVQFTRCHRIRMLDYKYEVPDG